MHCFVASVSVVVVVVVVVHELILYGYKRHVQNNLLKRKYFNTYC